MIVFFTIIANLHINKKHTHINSLLLKFVYAYLFYRGIMNQFGLFIAYILFLQMIPLWILHT